MALTENEKNDATAHPSFVSPTEKKLIKNMYHVEKLKRNTTSATCHIASLEMYGRRRPEARRATAGCA
jgi:hypothetical protein